MKILWMIFLLCFAIGCGRHEQTLNRIGAKEDVKAAGETDKTLVLINAVNSGDLQAVQDAVRDGASLDVRNNEGLTLIMVAIRAEQFAIIEYLVGQGVSLDMTTQSEAFNPDLDARQFLASQNLDEELKSILSDLLNKEAFDVEKLGAFMYSAITFKNVDLVRWLLGKGVSPNFIRKTSSGRDKDSPLIYLFTLKGVEGESFTKLQEIFQLFVSQPGVDVTQKVGRNTVLKKAESRLRQDPKYQGMVDTLIAMGA